VIFFESVVAVDDSTLLVFYPSEGEVVQGSTR
jgi:hypothetical protein